MSNRLRILQRQMWLQQSHCIVIVLVHSLHFPLTPTRPTLWPPLDSQFQIPSPSPRCSQSCPLPPQSHCDFHLQDLMFPPWQGITRPVHFLWLMVPVPVLHSSWLPGKQHASPSGGVGTSSYTGSEAMRSRKQAHSGVKQSWWRGYRLFPHWGVLPVPTLRGTSCSHTEGYQGSTTPWLMRPKAPMFTCSTHYHLPLLRRLYPEQKWSWWHLDGAIFQHILPTELSCSEARGRKRAEVTWDIFAYEWSCTKKLERTAGGLE